jgi:PAS domain S-box-containing protein
MANKKIKILAIDDNSDNLVVLKALISDFLPDAVYLSADSGKKGIELCQSEKPDVILLDIVMPGMDGYEVCKKLKSDIRLKHIPVVMVTANRADRESRVNALEAGADAFLPKPVDVSELKAQIRAMLRIKEAEDLKKAEKQHLEDMVLDRTEALELELADRKKAENKLIQSLDKITKNKQAIMNLMEDLKTEMGERKQVEEKLQVERNLLRTLVDNLPDTIYILDAEGRKVIANREDLKNIGFKTEAEVIGKNDLDLFPGDIGVRGHADNMSVINTATPIIDREEYFVDKKGTIRWLLTSKYPLYDANGKVNGLFGTGHDITERKKTAEKLKESEEQYRLLIQNQGEGVGIVNLNEEFVFANPAAEEMFGMGKGKLLHRSLMDFVDPDHLSIIINETTKRSKAEKSTYEIDIIRPNGERRTILITATPQFTVEGKLSGTFGVFRDITERKKLEQKVIESEAYYRTLIDISPDGIIIADLDGKVSYGSIKAYEIFGVPPGDDVKGTTVLRWIAPDFQQNVMERVMDIIKGNLAPETREYKLQKFDGTIFWGELSSSPLSDSYGGPVALMIVCRDISDRKNAESELIKSKEKAEESDRLKTAFLHNISHEIRTPMNAIIGFSSMLNEPDLDKESQNSYIEIITQSSNHLLSIVSDIIEISNIEAGVLKLSIKKADLNRLIRRLETHFVPKASEKNIEFLVNTGFKDSEAQIWIDEPKLEQVLSSLLSNAVKFTARGKITMGYCMKENFIEFFVSDTGIGISKEMYKMVFERFYQVESTIARQYEGTGLGLSIAKAYVELLGGSIWLTSEPGVGTTFYFTIPYKREEIPDVHGQKEIQKDTVHDYSNKTILIAEDEETNYRLIIELLSHLNLKIIHAENGKEAVEKFKSGNEIDLVLMDIKMPVMDGYEASSILKKLKPSLPIIAQTAFAFESDREKVFQAGCDDYLSKPIKKELLIEMVKKYL